MGYTYLSLWIKAGGGWMGEGNSFHHTLALPCLVPTHLQS